MCLIIRGQLSRAKEVKWCGSMAGETRYVSVLDVSQNLLSLARDGKKCSTIFGRAHLLEIFRQLRRPQLAKALEIGDAVRWCTGCFIPLIRFVV